MYIDTVNYIFIYLTFRRFPLYCLATTLSPFPYFKDLKLFFFFSEFMVRIRLRRKIQPKNKFFKSRGLGVGGRQEFTLICLKEKSFFLHIQEVPYLFSPTAKKIQM